MIKQFFQKTFSKPPALPNCFMQWRLLLAVLPLLVALSITGCSRTAEKVTPAPASWSEVNLDEIQQRVEVIVDYGDGVEKRFTHVPWREDMTVLDAMQWVQDHPRGVELSIAGAGENAFLQEIDHVENGLGNPARYWIYSVNQAKASKGMGGLTLASGDIVKWTFQQYSPGDDAN